MPPTAPPAARGSRSRSRWPPPHKRRNSSTAEMTRAMHRILVIEDDPAIRGVVTMLFETNGFRVVTADTCELAIRQAQSHRPDVCVVDLGLPDRDGLNFILQIRTWSPVPIIVLTARVQEAQRLAAFDAGADDYVIKPF